MEYKKPERLQINEVAKQSSAPRTDIWDKYFEMYMKDAKYQQTGYTTQVFYTQGKYYTTTTGTI